MADSYLFDLRGQMRVGKIASIGEAESDYPDEKTGEVKYNINMEFELVTKDGRPATNPWHYRFPKPAEGKVAGSKWAKFLSSFKKASKKEVRSYDDLIGTYCRIEDKEVQGRPRMDAMGNTEANVYYEFLVESVYRDVEEARAALGAKSTVKDSSKDSSIDPGPFSPKVSTEDAAMLKAIWSATGALGNVDLFKTSVASIATAKGYDMNDMIAAAK